MELKEYLERGGLTELDVTALDTIAVTRELEKKFLEFIDVVRDKANGRWLAIARTHFEEGGMAIRKAISMGPT